MATTYNDNGGATPNGSNLNFTYTFPILKTEDVKVALNGVTQATTKYSVNTGVNPTRIEFNNTSIDATVQESSGAPKTGVTVRVYRDTDVDSAKAVYAAGSSIRAQNLNDNQEQVLYALQEEQNQLILAERFADGSITSAKIKDGTIVNADIANDTITTAKLVKPIDLADDEKIRLGTGNDLQIWHEGSSGNSFITSGTTGQLQIKVNNTEASIVCIPDGSTSLYHDSSKKIETSSTGAEITGNIVVSGTVDGRDVAADGTKLDGIEANATADQTAAEIRTLVESASDSNVFTDADHTKLDGIATGAEVNVQSDWNSSSGDSQILNKPTIPELVDEDDFSSDSATKAPTQQSTKAYIAATSQPLDGDLTTLAGMQSATASILASGTALTSTTAELNLLDGKSIVTTISGSSTDVQLPTAKAVDDRVTALVTDVGGFVPIANETSFPATNPDPDDNAGTIVSVKALASNLTSNGSGVATIANGAGSGNTVTINGMANSDTIEAGKGILVETTSTLHTYTFHRETLAPADVTAAKTAVDDFNQRYQVTTDSTTPTNQPDGTALAEGDLWFDGGANTMKVYDGSNYSAVTSVGDYKLLTVVAAGTTNGTPVYTNTEFDLRDGSNAANVTSAGQLIISVNGVIQKPNAGTSIAGSAEGFCLADSNTIKFATAPGSGASVFVTLIGSATTVNVPATNSVAEATIQTNVVSEEKLKISNSPTNGQFLSAQSSASGGLTWADGASEGTSVKSTGESGGTKFLREDGDGTCSWQSVPAGVTQENVEDWVGGMVGSNTETGITVTYDDSDGTLDFVVADQTPTTTRGDIIYRGASADQRLAKGTSGQYLKIGANDPEWADVVAATADGVLWENNLTISNDYTIAATKGAHSVGPITNNATVTVNGRWVIS